jgi:hypothetical protein
VRQRRTARIIPTSNPILLPLGIPPYPRCRSESAFHPVVGHEEESGAGRGADDGGADAAVDACEAAGGEEAAAGLEAGLEGVDGVEGEVYCGACEGSCLGLLLAIHVRGSFFRDVSRAR